MNFKGVRIAWWKDLGGVPVDGRVKELVNAQRRVFESLGCVVDEAEPDFTDFDAVFKTMRALAFITGVADRVPDRIKRLVYLDALLPDSGESVMSIPDTARVERVIRLAERLLPRSMRKASLGTDRDETASAGGRLPISSPLTYLLQAMRLHGISLLRDAGNQATQGEAVVSPCRADLVFFGPADRPDAARGHRKRGGVQRGGVLPRIAI